MYIYVESKSTKFVYLNKPLTLTKLSKFDEYIF